MNLCEPSFKLFVNLSPDKIMKWALLGGTGRVPSKTVHLHSNGFIVLVAGAGISLLPAGCGDTG